MSEQETEKQLRALRSRMVVNAFGKEGQLDPRTAMIAMKRGILKPTAENPIPEAFVEVLENPAHSRRWPSSDGPLLILRDSDRRRATVELSTLFLNPDPRIRRAALQEFDRRNASQQQLTSPDTFQLLTRRRADLVEDDLRVSLDAAIGITDALFDDFFFQLAGVRQCARLRLDDELRHFLRRVLNPSERSFHFLMKLPVWSPGRQKNEIALLIDGITDRAASLQDLMAEYFKFFAHLPLSLNAAGSAVAARWLLKGGCPKDFWDEIWSWVRHNGSPLALYHACQTLVSNPNLVPESGHRDFANSLCEILWSWRGGSRWTMRQKVARHFCRVLETYAPGGDGERLSAYSWWFSEHLCASLSEMDSAVLNICCDVIDECSRQSEEVWKLCRPPVTLSPLRYSTHFSGSMWAASIACEISQSEFALRLCDDNAPLREALATALVTPSVWGVPAPNESEFHFAFQRATHWMPPAVGGWTLNSQLRDRVKDIIAYREHSTDSLDVGASMDRLAKAKPSEQVLIAHELRCTTFCGHASSGDFLRRFGDQSWRKAVLVDGDSSALELLSTAAVELQFQESNPEWLFVLPHFYALACEDRSTPAERKELLFAYTVVSSLATESVSAVARLLRGTNRQEFADYPAKWRKRIETLTTVASPWLCGKLRGVKAELYV